MEKAKPTDVMIEPTRGYVAYLLRLWQVSTKEETAWRASLESPHTGERRGFESLDDLFVYLRRQAWIQSDAEGAEDRTQ